MGTGSFPGVKSGRGVTLTPYPLLVPWSKKSRAIPPLPPWAVRPVQSLSACTRVHFTFIYFFGQQQVEMNVLSPLSWIIIYIKPRRVSKYNKVYTAVSRTVHKYGLQPDNFKGFICHLWSRGPGQLTRHRDPLRLKGLGIESKWRRYFPHSTRLNLRPIQPPVQWVPGLFPGSSAAGALRWPPIPN